MRLSEKDQKEGWVAGSDSRSRDINGCDRDAIPLRADCYSAPTEYCSWVSLRYLVEVPCSAAQKVDLVKGRNNAGEGRGVR